LRNLDKEKQDITNTLALPIDKKLYIYLLCPHSEHQNKIHSNLNSLNTFTEETGSPNVKTIRNKIKLPEVGSNVIWSLSLWGAGPNKTNKQPSLRYVERWDLLMCAL
jgi:hypothetical protein